MAKEWMIQSVAIALAISQAVSSSCLRSASNLPAATPILYSRKKANWLRVRIRG